VVAGALFISFVAFPSYRANWAFLRSAFSVKPGTLGNQARVDRSSEAAFQWLDSHTDDSDTVISEGNVDSSLWMYALHGVKPLIGLPYSFADRVASRDYQGRRYVVQHIDQLGKDARVDELVRHYRARWIYYDSRTFPIAAHALNIEALRSHAAIEEVFHRNGVSVFKVNVGGGRK
jgi:hypothetical protein